MHNCTFLQVSPFACVLLACFWYLVKRHTREEHHHVDDLVHDDGSLEADDEEHPAADVDPVLDQQSHDHVAQDLHDVLLAALLGLLLLYKTQQRIRELMHRPTDARQKNVPVESDDRPSEPSLHSVCT